PNQLRPREVMTLIKIASRRLLPPAIHFAAMPGLDDHQETGGGGRRAGRFTRGRVCARTPFQATMAPDRASFATCRPLWYEECLHAIIVGWDIERASQQTAL